MVFKRLFPADSFDIDSTQIIDAEPAGFQDRFYTHAKARGSGTCDVTHAAEDTFIFYLVRSLCCQTWTMASEARRAKTPTQKL